MMRQSRYAIYEVFDTTCSNREEFKLLLPFESAIVQVNLGCQLYLGELSRSQSIQLFVCLADMFRPTIAECCDAVDSV